MGSMLNLKAVAHIKSDFHTKFGVPRQSGIVPDLRAYVVFEPEFRSEDFIRGLESYSHLWLIWHFSQSSPEQWSPTVRPPRLGGNERVGVFASRAPFRPNPLGLSCVTLLGIEHIEPYGKVLCVGGADLVDGTPIFDIKPYILYGDCKPEATGRLASATDDVPLHVSFSGKTFENIPESLRTVLEKVLSLDPRPSYHEDESRIYGMDFGGMNVKFRVKGTTLEVLEVSPL